MKYIGEAGFKEKLKEYGPKIAIANGDNWPTIKLLLEDMKLYHPESKTKGKPLLITGDEKKRLRGKRKNGLFGLFSHNGKEYVQPVMVYLDDNFIHGKKSPYFSVMRPQEFPRNFKEGKIAVAIGAGYDLMRDRGTAWDEINKIRLNGKLLSSERDRVIKEELEKCGYYALPTGIKPIIYTLITSRETGIYELDDIKEMLNKGKTPTIISECPKIAKAFFLENGIDMEVKESEGSVDNQVMCGLYDIGVEIVETGKTLADNVDHVRLIKKNDNPIIVTYSCACIVTTQKEYEKERGFMDEFFGRMEENIQDLKKKEPDLFRTKYPDFFAKFEDLEKELEKTPNNISSYLFQDLAHC